MSDVTIEILRDIRDEIRQTRTELSSRIDATNQRLDATNERVEALHGRQVQLETRLSTELVAVVGAIHDLRDTLLEDRKLRESVANLETRVSRLERRAG